MKITNQTPSDQCLCLYTSTHVIVLCDFFMELMRHYFWNNPFFSFASTRYETIKYR